MTVRFYVMPITLHTTSIRYAKYFAFILDPTPPYINCPSAMKDYGLIDYCLVAADIADADHTALIANSDVLAIPINLDSTLTVGARNTARTFLENFNIPATNWLNTGMTYRAVLRTVTGMFLFVQRMTAILGHGIDFASVPLSIQWQNIPADYRSAMQQAANELGYNYSGVTATTTLRQILKLMADALGSQPVLFGFVTL